MGSKNGQFLPMTGSLHTVIFTSRHSVTSPRRRQHVTQTEERTRISGRSAPSRQLATGMEPSADGRSSPDEAPGRQQCAVHIRQWPRDLSVLTNSYIKRNRTQNSCRFNKPTKQKFRNKEATTMSIISKRTVRSAMAVVFALSAMFVWSHERTVTTNQTQVASATSRECFWLEGRWICPD